MKWLRKKSKRNRDWKSWLKLVAWVVIDVEALAEATVVPHGDDTGVAEVQVGEGVQEDTILVPGHVQSRALDLLVHVLLHALQGAEVAPGTDLMKSISELNVSCTLVWLHINNTLVCWCSGNLSIS